ncbi:DUF547 domain-containing protein [Verrucomicrobia bacterium S94]|nr:DUF547 domain-containing protein [Verrucomicrobia bacterium S94]
MKITVVLWMLAGSWFIPAVHAFDHTYESYNQMLTDYVEAGSVHYAGLKADPELLQDVLEKMGHVKKTEFNQWSMKHQLAYLINLYNVSTLQLVTLHYPVKSIKDIGSFFKGPWDQKIVPLFGEMITLNTLEHKIIRRWYREPRVHMALVCAARGCPPLRSEAYTAVLLDAQLDDQSRTYLSSPEGLVIDRVQGVVYLSAIFKWYGDDFESVEGFVEQYGRHALTNLKITYIDYDWSLNKQED